MALFSLQLKAKMSRCSKTQASILPAKKTLTVTKMHIGWMSYLYNSGIDNIPDHTFHTDVLWNLVCNRTDHQLGYSCYLWHHIVSHNHILKRWSYDVIMILKKHQILKRWNDVVINLCFSKSIRKFFNNIQDTLVYIEYQSIVSQPITNDNLWIFKVNSKKIHIASTS